MPANSSVRRRDRSGGRATLGVRRQSGDWGGQGIGLGWIASPEGSNSSSVRSILSPVSGCCIRLGIELCCGTVLLFPSSASPPRGCGQVIFLVGALLCGSVGYLLPGLQRMPPVGVVEFVLAAVDVPDLAGGGDFASGVLHQVDGVDRCVCLRDTLRLRPICSPWARAPPTSPLHHHGNSLHASPNARKARGRKNTSPATAHAACEDGRRYWGDGGFSRSVGS